MSEHFRATEYASAETPSKSTDCRVPHPDHSVSATFMEAFRGYAEAAVVVFYLHEALFSQYEFE